MKPQYISYFTLFSLIALAVDQSTKMIIRLSMVQNSTIPVIPEMFHFTFIQNPGAAFGLLPGKKVLLLVIASLVSFLVVYFHRHIRRRDLLTQAALGFIFGGSLGNILDRLVLGSVTDFFDLRFWPIFNFADIFINLGVFLLILRAFQNGREKHGADNI